MDPITIAVLSSIGSALGAGALAIVGSSKATKATLNGTVARTERIENKLDSHIQDSHENKMAMSERLTRIETKLED